MDRTQRIAAFWAWLPAFRVVAETEHLPSAARTLHVTPSALSRTIRLLEDDLGQRLFEREGRRIRLNPAGEDLLHAVRDAMRLVHEGYGAVRDARFVGPVTVSCATPLTAPLLFEALRALRASHPGLVPTLRPTAVSRIPGELLTGRLDLALVDGNIAHPELSIERLGGLEHRVFAAPDHPLCAAPPPSPARVLAEPFVAPPSDAEGLPVDAWPPHLDRTVVLRVERMQLGVDACREGLGLCVLPLVVGRRAGLVAIPFEPLPETPLHLVHRRTLPMPGRAELVAEAVRAHLNSQPG